MDALFGLDCRLGTGGLCERGLHGTLVRRRAVGGYGGLRADCICWGMCFSW